MNGVPGSSSTTGTSASLGGYNKGNNHNGRHNGQYQVNGINGSGNGAGGGGAGNGSGVIHNGQYRPRVNGLNGLNGNGKENQIILRLFLVIAIYCQASSSQFNQSLNLPPVPAGWEVR